VATTPSEHFRLPAEDYADAEDVGEVLAVVHSQRPPFVVVAAMHGQMGLITTVLGFPTETLPLPPPPQLP
jgi:hypothetical protein